MGGIELNVLLFVPSSADGRAVEEWLCSSLCALCERAEGSPQDAEHAGRVLSGKERVWLQQMLCWWDAGSIRTGALCSIYWCCFSEGDIFNSQRILPLKRWFVWIPGSLSNTAFKESRVARCMGPVLIAHQIKNITLMQSAPNISNENYLAADILSPSFFFYLGTYFLCFLFRKLSR